MLERQPDHASTIVVLACITRRQPEEAAAGTSDLEVFDVLDKRAGTTLLLTPRFNPKSRATLAGPLDSVSLKRLHVMPDLAGIRSMHGCGGAGHEKPAEAQRRAAFGG